MVTDAPPPFYIYIFDATANEVHHHERWCHVSMKDIFIYIYTHTRTRWLFTFSIFIKEFPLYIVKAHLMYICVRVFLNNLNLTLPCGRQSERPQCVCVCAPQGVLFLIYELSFFLYTKKK